MENPRNTKMYQPCQPTDKAFELPPDLIRLICEFTCDLPADYLSIGLVSRDFCMQTSALLSSDHSDLLTDDTFVSYFPFWSELRLNQPPAYQVIDEGTQSTSAQLDHWVGRPFGPLEVSDQGPYYYCRACKNCVISSPLIESDQYQGGLGPAFLTYGSLNSSSLDSDAYETQYTTGVYLVCDVLCGKRQSSLHSSGCGTVLGKKYIKAYDPGNRYKESKILMEQVLVELPRCCLSESTSVPPGRFRQAWGASTGGVSSPPSPNASAQSTNSVFCSACIARVRATAKGGLLKSTRNFNDRPAMHALLQALQKEAPLLGGRQGSFRRKVAALVQKIFGKEGSVALGTSVGVRLAMLLTGDESETTFMDVTPVHMTLQTQYDSPAICSAIEAFSRTGLDKPAILAGLTRAYLWNSTSNSTSASNLSALLARVGSECKTAMVEAALSVAGEQNGILSVVLISRSDAGRRRTSPIRCLSDDLLRGMDEAELDEAERDEWKMKRFLSPKSPGSARNTARMFLRKIDDAMGR